jgi:hypothetical protein
MAHSRFFRGARGPAKFIPGVAAAPNAVVGPGEAEHYGLIAGAFFLFIAVGTRWIQHRRQRARDEVTVKRRCTEVAIHGPADSSLGRKPGSPEEAGEASGRSPAMAPLLRP